MADDTAEDGWPRPPTMRRRPFANLAGATVVIAASVAASCVHKAAPQVTENDPVQKIPAIQAAVGAGDRSVVPKLVEDLSSDDPAVRFYAIDGLRRLTGQTLGYEWWRADSLERREAVEKWHQWLGQTDKAAPATTAATQ